jgi:hypothetical protein
MLDLLRRLGTKSYLFSECGTEASRKDRDLSDVHWLTQVNSERFYLENLQIQQIAQAHPSRN